jgi:hypothetical protein
MGAFVYGFLPKKGTDYQHAGGFLARRGVFLWFCQARMTASDRLLAA